MMYSGSLINNRSRKWIHCTERYISACPKAAYDREVRFRVGCASERASTACEFDTDVDVRLTK